MSETMSSLKKRRIRVGRSSPRAVIRGTNGMNVLVRGRRVVVMFAIVLSLFETV
jgi:hypothetical protein